MCAARAVNGGARTAIPELESSSAMVSVTRMIVMGQLCIQFVRDAKLECKRGVPESDGRTRFRVVGPQCVDVGWRPSCDKVTKFTKLHNEMLCSPRVLVSLWRNSSRHAITTNRFRIDTTSACLYIVPHSTSRDLASANPNAANLTTKLVG